jgi:hypothetical protein
MSQVSERSREMKNLPEISHWHVVSVDAEGKSRGCISPAILRLASQEEAETIAERYRKAYPGQFFAAKPFDRNDYVVRENA